MAYRIIDPRDAGSGRKHRELRNAGRVGLAEEPGWIRPDGGFAKRACTVLDISDTGVRIRIGGDFMVPSTFNFVSGRLGGLGRPARVKWRHGNEIGAEFF